MRISCAYNVRSMFVLGILILRRLVCFQQYQRRAVNFVLIHRDSVIESLSSLRGLELRGRFLKSQ